MPTASRIILGIDPGLATTGYGVIADKKHELTVRQFGTITSAAQTPFGDRLAALYRGIATLIRRHRPHEIAIEELFFAKNTTTALKVGQARGVVVLAAAQAHLTIREFTPLQVKQAITGYGFAPKLQVQKMVAMILKLKTLPKSDDAADALAIAICSAGTKQFTD